MMKELTIEAAVENIDKVTAFVTEELDKLHLLIKKYPHLVQESTFLTERVRNMYLEEKDTVAQLTQQNVEAVRAFCAKTIEETTHNCFG